MSEAISQTLLSNNKKFFYSRFLGDGNWWGKPVHKMCFLPERLSSTLFSRSAATSRSLAVDRTSNLLIERWTLYHLTFTKNFCFFLVCDQSSWVGIILALLWEFKWISSIIALPSRIFAKVVL